ncbi:MAG TPA: histidine kinase [Burkholderiaceae bacterium]|nr:histidine kinase [Burkholderiaceae bacterium]
MALLTSPAPRPASDRPVWLAYAGLCLLCWALYVMAGTDWQRGAWHMWKGLYLASWNMGPPIVLGCAGLPWARWLQRRAWPVPRLLALHAAGAAVFVSGWQALDYAASVWLYGVEHSNATLQRMVLWQAMWGVFVYVALMLGFSGALHARRANAVALGAARAEAALVRAELAAISGKLNPHFLFNTLNSLLMLTRRDPAAAEQSLLRFSRMMRYVLGTSSGSAERVTLQEELDFVRDYLELESLRLGPRLKVDWQIDPATVHDTIPPLTLQPLVENSVLHGIAPRVEGGTVRIHTKRLAEPEALSLRVDDDGAGCTWPPPAAANSKTGGIGLSALRRRFELDFGGRAELSMRSAPGAGFQVHILIPRTELVA